jgi:predicted  nucleic acid-binding Zn-ribbon protein
VNADLRNLIALQDLEQKIAGLQKQIHDIPIQVQTLQDELQRLTTVHQERIARSQDLAKRRRSLEGDVDLMRTKLARLKDQLMSVKTNKEYTAMLHEIQTAEAQIRSEEDKVLEIMEELETMEGDLKGAEKTLKLRTAEVGTAIQKCQDSVPGIERELENLKAERTRTETLVEVDLLSRYRRIAEVRKGIALAEARDELCMACHVRIRPQVFADLFKTENIYSCDSCSRILFLRDVP